MDTARVEVWLAALVVRIRMTQVAVDALHKALDLLLAEADPAPVGLHVQEAIRAYRIAQLHVVLVFAELEQPAEPPMRIATQLELYNAETEHIVEKVEPVLAAAALGENRFQHQNRYR